MVPVEQLETGGGNAKERRPPVVRILAAPYDALLYEVRQATAHRRARIVVEKQKLFERERPPLFFRVADLDDDIEIDHGFQEWHLRTLKFPHSPQSSKYLHVLSFLIVCCNYR